MFIFIPLQNRVIEHEYIYVFEVTRMRGSARLVHIEISSLTLMSGYRFLIKRDSSSCSCWDVKCVRCLRIRLLSALSTKLRL